MTLALTLILTPSPSPSPSPSPTPNQVLKPLWKGIRQHRGKGLAAFLKAIGFIIPLMDAEYANYYTREVRDRVSGRGRGSTPTTTRARS